MIRLASLLLSTVLLGQRLFAESSNCNRTYCNVKTMNGTLQNYNRLESCRAACVLNISSTCQFGFYWDTEAPQGAQCWFSTNTIYIAEIGFDYYICKADDTTSNISNQSNCYITNNAYTLGALRQPYCSLNACMAGCLFYIASTCQFGFDWNSQASTGSQCLFSITRATYPGTGINHYNCAPGNCNNVTKDVNTMGGIKQIYADLNACKAACLVSIATICKFGFDWNNFAPIGSQCWFSTVATTNQAPGVDHYYCSEINIQPYTPAPPKGKCSITGINTYTTSGITQTYTTLDDCITACLLYIDAACQLGFDWNTLAPVGSQCLFSSSTTANLGYGIHHYTCYAN